MGIQRRIPGPFVGDNFGQILFYIKFEWLEENCFSIQLFHIGYSFSFSQLFTAYFVSKWTVK